MTDVSNPKPQILAASFDLDEVVNAAKAHGRSFRTFSVEVHHDVSAAWLYVAIPCSGGLIRPPRSAYLEERIYTRTPEGWENVYARRE
jgi:hypothetical protein